MAAIYNSGMLTVFSIVVCNISGEHCLYVTH